VRLAFTVQEKASRICVCHRKHDVEIAKSPFTIHNSKCGATFNQRWN
jgi:hypothetical protein